MQFSLTQQTVFPRNISRLSDKMPRFVIDEDMPRSTGRELTIRGHEVIDARDCGLRGATDDEVYEYAEKHGAVLITGDRHFGNVLRFPLGGHHGIVIAHFPNETPVGEMNRVLLGVLGDLSAEDLRGNLIIIEPRKVRIRRKH